MTASHNVYSSDVFPGGTRKLVVTMATINQVSLLPAGSQPWYREICSVCGDWFAYSATQAIYIYKVRVTAILHSLIQWRERDVWGG